MLQGWVIVAASFAYLGVLFAIAWTTATSAPTPAARSSPTPTSTRCRWRSTARPGPSTAASGRAASTGIGFLPIYLGPTLMLALWWFVCCKMIRISKANRITSIADFVASRYGKSQLLGGLVTVIAVVGVIPYIALQLKAVSTSFTILLQLPGRSSCRRSVGSGAAAAATAPSTSRSSLAAFTILFGTRHLDATERHEGMVAAIAFESVVKLVAFLAVGLFVTFGIYDGFADIFSRAAAGARTGGADDRAAPPPATAPGRR